VTEDDVIEDADADQVAHRTQTVGQGSIFRRWRRVTRRVLVNQNSGG